MIKVYVVAPDIYSGDAFNKVLNKYGIETEFHFHKIRPRVIENKITKSKNVIRDMNAIFATFDDKTKSVVIACNTLQLWLPNIDKKFKRNVKVYTTFEACEWKFKNKKNKPLWLGTTPLVRVTKKFPTLISLKNDEEAQQMVQELIWRVKMYGGDDIQTAPQVVKKDFHLSKSYQKAKINNFKSDIISLLKSYGIKNVITGCTELPLVFDKETEDGINFFDPAKVLAEYIKSQSVSILFAGGTISSLANNNGLRQQGKAFDLLERLSKTMPGSYKKLNITKDKVIYSGFSENLTTSDRNRLLIAVTKTLETDISRIVITHGTDSMEETARFLNKKLKTILKKLKIAVVLTGAKDSVGSRKTDAWKNLKKAINNNFENKVGGVYVAFHDEFIPASEVTKEFYNGKQINYISTKDRKYKESLIKFESFKEAKKNLIIKNYLSDLDNPNVLEYNLNKLRKSHNMFYEKIQKTKPNAVLFILYHSSTANVVSNKISASKLISKVKRMGILPFGITENGEPTDLTKYPSSVELKRAGLIPI